MKFDVYTIRFGNPPWMELCAPTLDAWCARHKLDLHMWTDETARIKGYPDVKFCVVDMLESFLASDADQMMYVDADVVVRPDAPFPEFGPGMHIRCHGRRVNNPYWLPWLAEHYQTTPDGGGNYRNAGVWVIDRASAAKLLESISQPYILGIMEQHQFNWWMMLAEREGLVIHGLQSVWNAFPKELRPAWFFHIYGTNKFSRYAAFKRAGLFSPAKHPMKQRNIVKPKAPVRTVNPRHQWPMHMDDMHVQLLRDLLTIKRPAVAMEVGSHKGVSTQAFLDALDAGEIGQLHIVELEITPELQKRINRCQKKDRVHVHLKPSWELLIPCHFVFIDGDHRWPAYADVLTALALKTPVIAMHDTNSLSIGISSCYGSEGASRVLQACPDREWCEDKLERAGVFTHRGFGWSVLSTKDQACISTESEPT